MKAKELMIGDWVKDKYKLKPSRVDSWSDFNSAEDLSFIPISPEILEKNGFIIDSDGWYVWNDGIHNPYQHYISISFRHNKSIHHIEIRANKVHTNYENLQNVHELQHALRLCGLDKLADNFKI